MNRYRVTKLQQTDSFSAQFIVERQLDGEWFSVCHESFLHLVRKPIRFISQAAASEFISEQLQRDRCSKLKETV